MKRSPAPVTKRLSAFVISTLIANVIAILLRICNLNWFYDIELGYYKSSAFLPILGNVLLTVFAVGIAVFARFVFIKDELTLPKPTLLPRLVAILPATGALLAAIGMILNGNAEDYISALPFQVSTLFGAYAVFAVITAAFFFLLAAGILQRPKRGGLILLLGLFSILFFVAALAVAYFDFEVQMNSPNKLIFQLACLSAMLALLADMRILADAQKPRFSLFAFSLATLFLGSSSVPSVFAYMKGIFPSDYRNLLADFVCMALWCYCLIRLIWIAYPSEEKKAESPAEEATEEVQETMSEEPLPETDPQEIKTENTD